MFAPIGTHDSIYFKRSASFELNSSWMAERTSIAHSQLSTSIEAKRIHKALSCNDSSMLIPCAYLLDLNIPKKPHLGRKEAILFILDPQFPVAILAKRKHSSSI